MSLPIAILAGGLATRLRPLTDNIPKALIEICGEPFIAHQLRLLGQRGIREVVLCLGYRGEMIEQFVGSGAPFGLNVQYSYDGAVLRGTGGAIRHALPLLGDSFFVMYGDSYLPCDYSRIEQAFHAASKPGLMTVFRNEGRWEASNVEFDGARILMYDKTNRTDRMRHIDYGLSVLTRTAIESAGGADAFDLSAVHQHLVARGELAAFEVTERFYEIGSLDGIRELTARLMGPS